MNAALHTARILVLTSMATLGLVNPVLAHPGHISAFRTGVLHYLAGPDHLLPAVFVGFCAGMLMIRTRSHWLVRSGRLVVAGSLALLLVRLF